MRSILSIAGGVTALLLLGSAGHAEEDTAETQTGGAHVSSFDAARPLSLEELGEQRAAARIEVDDVTINTADSDGAVVDNTAINNRTGQNTIAGGAFVGAAGFIHSVQNTGNNVLIQNSTIINVSVEP